MQVSYRNNEWVAVYVDADGKRQVEPFDTMEEAVEFLSSCYSKIGVMSTTFYHHYIEKIIDGE